MLSSVNTAFEFDLDVAWRPPTARIYLGMNVNYCCGGLLRASGHRTFMERIHLTSDDVDNQAF